MDIGYVEPLGRAFQRMKRSLFLPFDFSKWFVVGFAAWLSELGQSPGATFGYRFGSRGEPSEAIREAFDRVIDWLRNPLLLAAVVAAVLIALALATLLAWIRARGRFVFLDAVARDRAAVAEPWRRFREQGNSVFWWRVAFTCAVLLSWLPGLLVLLVTFGLGGPWDGDILHHLGFVQIGVLALFFLYAAILLVASLIVHLLFEHFVVPLMYRDGTRATAAWKKLMPLFRQHAGSFLLWMLLWVVLWIVVAALVVATGCLTCCVGFVILMIPYLWAVALLPVLFTARGYGAEFLAQFGPDYSIFLADAQTDPVPAAPTSTPEP